MGSLLEILEKIQDIDVDQAATRAIQNTHEAGEDAQRQQLAQGLRSDGTFMPEYSFRSVFQYGKEPGPIKLYDTGDFYRGIRIDVRGDLFIADSLDRKYPMLRARYGDDITGLGKDARIEYIRILKPEFVHQISLYLK